MVEKSGAGQIEPAIAVFSQLSPVYKDQNEFGHCFRKKDEIRFEISSFDE